MENRGNGCEVIMFWEFRLMWEGEIVRRLYSMPQKHNYHIPHIDFSLGLGEKHRYLYDDQATKELNELFIRVFVHSKKRGEVQ